MQHICLRTHADAGAAAVGGIAGDTVLRPRKTDITDANFPVDADGRTYHLGTRRGEVANRVLSVGSEKRALMLAEYLQPPAPGRGLFMLESSRGFLTITGAPPLGHPLHSGLLAWPSRQRCFGTVICMLKRRGRCCVGPQAATAAVAAGSVLHAPRCSAGAAALLRAQAATWTCLCPSLSPTWA